MIRFKTYSVIRPVSREVIEDALRNTNGKDILFVAPEFSKAQIEREVLAYKEQGSKGDGRIHTEEGDLTLSASLVSGDVLSFRKLAGNILDDLGTNYVSEGGEIMLRNAIYNILANNKNKLNAFGTLSSRIDYINMMIALLGDFSRYGVGIDDIDQAIKTLDNPGSSVPFLNKLKDLHLIMDELEQLNAKFGLNLLREPIALACDKLAKADPKNLSSRRASGLANTLNSKIVFIGFGSTRMLTPKEIRLVSLLSELGCDIEFNVIVGKADSQFSSVYKNGEDFRAMLEALGASGSALAVQDTDDPISLIVKAFATDIKPDGIDAQDKIRLAELSGIDDRVGYIFNEVIDLTRNHGYRYRDIRIVCCNEDIIPRMRSTAEIYGLDIFIDRKIALGGTVVPYMMQILLELPRAGYTLELIMKAMRSGLLRIPPYIADSFENYCYARNITDAGRLFDENAYVDTDDGEHKKKYRLWIIEGTVPGIKEGFVDSGKFFCEYVVKRSLIPLRQACESIYKEKTLSGKARKSLEFFNSMRGFIEPLRDEFIARGDDAAAVALVRGYDELIGLLMCSTHEMNNCEISQKDFLTMVRTDMRNRTEGTIPLKVDSIEITTPEHAFVTPCKVLFIIGAQKDNFPYMRMREGLLSSLELKNLSNASESIELPDKAQSKMREEFVTACLLLGAAADLIYMVHEYGKPKSRVFEYLEACAKPQFHIVNTFKNPIAGETIKFRHNYEDAKIPADVMSRLLTVKKEDGTTGKAIYASVSSIEGFRQCAFQSMMQRQLRIEPREDNTKIQPNSFGSLIHGMFEAAYRALREASDKDPAKFRQIAEVLLKEQDKYDQFADICLKSSVSSRASFGSVDKEGNPKDKVFEMDTCAKLRRMFSKMFRDVLTDSVNTGFVPEGVEEKIGSGELVLDIPYEGIDLKFSGFIDRYDRRVDEANKIHLRTIDYKSGDKAVDSSELLNGTQIQLPAYSGAILDKHSKEGDAVIDDYGYVLVGLKASDDGTPIECLPKLAGYDDEAMRIAIDYSKHIIKESIDQIADGKADAVTAEPKLKLCSYCSYKGYCGNDPTSPKSRQQIDLSSRGKYGAMVDACEKFAEPTKSGKQRKDPGYDGITKKIGADQSMSKADRKAILAMKDILENKDRKNDGKEE
ncbi:MAG: PD-(D/E)XK nuclease family protein [Saccharofermentans sp.]|nr:PD-(D/E)XK nuclease family protein [Saccharofermentans sp.]